MNPSNRSTPFARADDCPVSEIGGVMAYQQASALNTALNKTSAWVVQVLRQRKLLKRDARLRVLEVGAINTQLLDEPELATRAIDLHAINSRIEQCDFFSLPYGGELDAATGTTIPYDAVSYWKKLVDGIEMEFR